ncbi:UNVERIFIED_CONTAM: hypothetical protein Sindi_2631400 [Sesamum indicum]
MPLVLSTEVARHDNAMVEGKRESSHNVVPSTRCKSKLIGADDSDEADDDGDDLPLSSLAVKGISILERKINAPAKKVTKTSKSGVGKGKTKISPHPESQILAKLEGLMVNRYDAHLSAFSC